MKYESDLRALREEYESLQGQLAMIKEVKNDMSITFNQNVAEKETIIQSLKSQLIEAQKLAHLELEEAKLAAVLQTKNKYAERFGAMKLEMADLLQQEVNKNAQLKQNVEIASMEKSQLAENLKSEKSKNEELLEEVSNVHYLCKYSLYKIRYHFFFV